MHVGSQELAAFLVSQWENFKLSWLLHVVLMNKVGLLIPWGLENRVLWSHVFSIVILLQTSNIPQSNIGSYVGLNTVGRD